MQWSANKRMNAKVQGMVVPPTSLRERSKAKRRIAIQRAALRLFAERGYDGATIAEIAEEAELAPRTVTLYFPNKIDIAMSTSADMAARLTATYQAHPELSFTEGMDRWLTGEESEDPELAKLTNAMFDANPALRAVSNSHFTEAATALGPALVAELGLPDEHPMTKIAGGALGGAISEYLTYTWSHGATADRHQELVQYLRAIIAAANPS
jgi:AcrR family transcriptional regulator